MPVDLSDLEVLRALATEVLKPEPGMKVNFVVTSDEVMESMLGEDASTESNVVPLHGGPIMTGEEYQQEERNQTIEVLEHYLELARRGEIRHVAIVAGLETNERFMGSVQTGMSVGAEEHLSLMLGGCELLKKHMTDIFSQVMNDDLEDEE